MATQESFATGLVMGRLTGIDGKTTGVTTIYANIDPMQFYPLLVVLEGDTISGFSVGPTVSFGTDANASNVIAATAVTVPDAASYAVFTPKMFSVACHVAGGSFPNFQVKVTVAATATVYTFKVLVYGVHTLSGVE